MTERVFIVESNDEAFERWNDPDDGLAAQVEAMGGNGSRVEVERITSAAELLELASEVKTARHLPARALVFQGTGGTDLRNEPYTRLGFTRGPQLIDTPADFEVGTDPRFVWSGDENRPLDPYGRLLAARLVRRAVPDVLFAPVASASDDGPEDEDPQLLEVRANPDLFGWSRGPMDSLMPSPRYGGFLARANRLQALGGQPFMAIVDGTEVWDRDTSRYSDHRRRELVEGADIAGNLWTGDEATYTDREGNRRSHRDLTAIRIGRTANLVRGYYPAIPAQHPSLPTKSGEYYPPADGWHPPVAAEAAVQQ